MQTKVKDLNAQIEQNGWVSWTELEAINVSTAIPPKSGTSTVVGKASVDVPIGTLHNILQQAGLKK